MRGAVFWKVGRAAIHRDTGANPVSFHGCVLRMAQAGGAVAHTALAGQVARGFFKTGHLLGNAFGAVGVAEVRHERNLIHLGQGVQARPGRAKALRRKAQPVHAGVHFEEDPVRLVRLVQRQHVDLFVAMHRVPQVQPRAQLQVARLKSAFEQQYGAAPAQGAHALGFAQVQQGKAIGPTQTFKHPLDAMAIRIRLDHGPGLGIGCGLPGTAQVMAQGCGVDAGLDGAGHGV